jgi:hypothetical protein
MKRGIIMGCLLVAATSCGLDEGCAIRAPSAGTYFILSPMELAGGTVEVTNDYGRRYVELETPDGRALYVVASTRPDRADSQLCSK